jgi:hypothetical protein
MRVFQASIDQMLWPEKREQDKLLGDKVHGKIDRTSVRSQITIPVGYVPEVLRPLQGVLHRWLPGLVTSGGDVTLGPIPKDMPVNLLANVRLLAEDGDKRVEHAAELVGLVVRLKADLLLLPRDASDDEVRQRFANVKDRLLKLDKCPDFVVNRGHLFGTEAFNEQDNLSDDEKAFGTEPALSDDDKRALIEFVKTF